MKLCKVDGCKNQSGTGRGMCHKHYKRWQLHGHTGLTNGRGSTDPVERLAFRSQRLSNGCLEWTGTVSKRGYGQTKWNYKFYSVHRLAWTLANGRIPNGMFVCHHCDNPRCFEISHLFLGNSSDNRQDCIRKNRANLIRGSSHWKWKGGEFSNRRRKWKSYNGDKLTALEASRRKA